ncbi:flagellar basal body-associated protein FliL [Variovorax dokdonensis]|uniref:Flagellar protein FliL n=1 Tax=Variovorax dokdonensis TaxID=344883 RepID=A0ABT7N4W4_9BURK|nr:flagellar basal body-associated protein FliL [Variovorax dokdonensis]MDM0042960.1 flagellar basal body-associated protein FliL [Variovorax dokdonensis]
MATSKTAAAADAAPAGGSSASKMLIGVLLGVVLVGAGGAGAWFMLGRQSAPAQAAAPVLEKPIFVTVEPFTVNLQDEGRPKFLHLGMTLRVRDEKSRAQVAEFMPELRSRAMLILSNRKPDTLVSTEDKSRVAEEIRTEMNRPLAEDMPSQGIAGVSFNTFVVQ